MPSRTPPTAPCASYADWSKQDLGKRDTFQCFTLMQTDPVHKLDRLTQQVLGTTA
jgi:hypothetical protein